MERRFRILEALPGLPFVGYTSFPGYTRFLKLFGNSLSTHTWGIVIRLALVGAHRLSRRDFLVGGLHHSTTARIGNGNGLPDLRGLGGSA